MSTPRPRLADLPVDPAAPRKGRPAAPEEQARRHQIQIRVTKRTEDMWRAFLVRLQSEQTIGVVPQGDALALLLEDEARRAEAKAARRGAGKA